MSDTTLALKPEHIPDHLVVDFDAYFGDGKNPSQRRPDDIADLQEKVGPIFWTPRNGGHWMFVGYKAIYDMARDTETFSSDPRVSAHEKDNPIFIPVNLDPPQHEIYRMPLNVAMSPKKMLALSGDIRMCAANLIAKFARRGKVDALPAFTEPLPVTVFLRLMGMPVERMEEFRALNIRLLVATDHSQRGAVIREMRDVCAPYIKARMEKRENDLISQLLDSKIEGRGPTFEDMLGYCILLFSAGLDTVANTMSFAVYHLAIDQELQARLRKDPTLIPDAIEEMMRRYSIVQTRRYVAKDTVFHNVTMKRSEPILYCTPSANLDPEVYDSARTVDIERRGEPHLGFLVGPHRCAGSHLARLEMRIGHEELLKALPPFRLDSSVNMPAKLGQIYGLESVPLVWDV